VVETCVRMFAATNPTAATREGIQMSVLVA
jgi:hypothetical protein